MNTSTQPVMLPPMTCGASGHPAPQRIIPLYYNLDLILADLFEPRISVSSIVLMKVIAQKLEHSGIAKKKSSRVRNIRSQTIKLTNLEVSQTCLEEKMIKLPLTLTYSTCRSCVRTLFSWALSGH